jgi:hypothetical protein
MAALASDGSSPVADRTQRERSKGEAVANTLAAALH